MKHQIHTPKVFIPNKGFHDYQRAERFGELVYITEGSLNRFEVNQLARQCDEALRVATPGDYILLSSLPVISAIAAAMFAVRFGRINILQHDNRSGEYISRSIVIPKEVVDGVDWAVQHSGDPKERHPT